MPAEVLIAVERVGKFFARAERPLAQMTRLLLGSETTGGFQALEDVTFSLARGEAIGIVGRNGAGKSTLLQIICGTQSPSHGRVATAGRIAAMLQLGAGFKPEFTGRENVYLNASVYGLSDHDIDARFAQIAAFADIGEFIDRPVSVYSSGMYARLAFAVCAHVDADILVIDEVLAVGDAAFQAKCRRFIQEFLKRGAVVFVSHDEGGILSLCNRAIWLEKGRQMADGAPDSVLRLYRRAVATETEPPEVPACGGRTPGPPEMQPASSLRKDRRFGKNPILVSSFSERAPSHGHGGAIIHGVHFSEPEGNLLDRLQGGQTVVLNIGGQALREIERPIVGFIFRDALGQNLFGDNTFLEYRDRPQRIGAGEAFAAQFEFQLPYLPVGTYSISPSIIEGTQQSHLHLHWMEEALVLTVHQSPVSSGKIGIPIDATHRITSGTGGGEPACAGP